MTPKDQDRYRGRLDALRDRLAAGRAAVEAEARQPIGGEAAGGLSDVPLHPADLGTSTHDAEVNAGLLENETALLAEVDAALARLDRGTYGRCEACGEAISPRRLDALPYVRYCLRDAERLEGEAP